MDLHDIKFFTTEIRKIKRQLPHPIARFVPAKTQWKPLRDSVLGQYNHWSGWITLNSKMNHSPELLVSTLIRELHHKWQHDTMGWKYILLANYITRDRFLEVSAREVENAADELMGNAGMRSGDE